MKFKTLCVFLLVLLLSSCGGCGEKLPYDVVAIRGTVTVEGKPAPKGLRLQFAPANGEGRPSEAIVGDEGRFKAIYSRSVEGVQVGKAVLIVSWGGGTSLPPEAAGIIKKYGENAKGIPLEITKPDKEFKIELK